MEVSNQQENQVGEREQRRQATTIAPVAPERETPVEMLLEMESMDENDEQTHLTQAIPCSEPGEHADMELTIMLKQIEAYFIRQAREHDLEAVSFCLRHLFSRVDFLYRQALPELERWTTREVIERGRETFHNQQIWLHLQSVNRTLDRMAPLCHLLSDVIECLLDTLDNEEAWLRTFEEEETLLLEQMPDLTLKSAAFPPSPADSIAETAPPDAEAWERSVAILMDRLLIWQDQQHKLTSFLQQFARPALLSPNLAELDTSFAILLDSASAIFGDILPNFRSIGPEDKEEIGALLFDLMQQSDQMLVQFEVTLEPLTGLLRHFATVCEKG